MIKMEEVRDKIKFEDLDEDQKKLLLEYLTKENLDLKREGD